MVEGMPVDTRAVTPDELRRVAGPADLAPGTALGRYRVRSEIGRGGMGVVYEAEDASTGGLVALKVILPHLLAIEGVRERFGREARLGAVVAHDNVVRTLDLGEATIGGRVLHYLVMERVHDKTLRRLLEALGTVPEALLREIAVQAARGLAALHAVGVVHRDVKPENILLADDRRVRIMDLGVAQVAGGTGGLTQEGQFIGSFRYASPEQCEGGTIGPAADLYALGVALFELAVGHAPFEGDDIAALVRAHAEVRPAPIAELNPLVSDFFSDVVATLLEKRVERRFRSARELEQVLVEAETGGWWTARRRQQRTPRTARTDVGAAPALIGRDAERATLLDAWRSARGSESRLVRLAGDAGMGKSRLVQELLGAVSDTDVRLLRSDVGPAGDSSALRGALLAHLPSTAPEAALVRGLELDEALAAAFLPWLKGHPAAEGVERPAPGTCEALFARLARSLADEGPLLWIVDDAHYADAETRKLILAVARALVGRPALLVVSAEPTMNAAVSGALGQISGFVRIDLGRLSDEDVVRLSSQLVGGTTLGGELGRTLAPRVDGIPYFVVEMVRELERRGRLVRDAGGALRRGAALDAFEIPSALQDLLRARVLGLSLEERAVLETAAVEGFEFDPHLVATVRGLPRLDVLEILGRLERRDGLVRSDARRARFQSHLLQEIVYEDIPAALRAETHARMADALDAAAPKGERASLVAHHRVRSSEPERTLPIAMAALLELERAGRPEAVVDLARRILGLAATPPRLRVEVLVTETYALTLLARHDDIRAALDEGLALARTHGLDDLRPRLDLAEARHCFSTGKFEACLAKTNALLAAGPLDRPADRAAILTWRGQALWTLGRHAEAKACHEQAIAEAVAAGRLADELDACVNLAAVLDELGLLTEAETRLRRAIEISRITGRRNFDATMLTLGNVLTDQGKHRDALACYEASLEHSRRVGSREGEAVAYVNIGAVRQRFGDLEGSESELDRAAEICRTLGSRRVLGYAIAALAEIDYLRGDHSKARTRFEEALALRRALDNRHAIATTLHMLAVLDEAEGRHDAARVKLDEAESITNEVGDPNTAVLCALLRARLPGGDLTAARRAFDASRSRLRRGPLIEALTMLWMAGGVRRDLDEARALLEVDLGFSPPNFRAAMVERIPLFRRIVEDSARLGAPIRIAPPSPP
jgi:tetratricopeptide (TPR) repeat protein